jgi:hypothetical protein
MPPTGGVLERESITVELPARGAKRASQFGSSAKYRGARQGGEEPGEARATPLPDVANIRLIGSVVQNSVLVEHAEVVERLRNSRTESLSVRAVGSDAADFVGPVEAGDLKRSNRVHPHAPHPDESSIGRGSTLSSAESALARKHW